MTRPPPLNPWLTKYNAKPIDVSSGARGDVRIVPNTSAAMQALDVPQEVQDRVMGIQRSYLFVKITAAATASQLFLAAAYAVSSGAPVGAALIVCGVVSGFIGGAVALARNMVKDIEQLVLETWGKQ